MPVNEYALVIMITVKAKLNSKVLFMTCSFINKNNILYHFSSRQKKLMKKREFFLKIILYYLKRI